MPIDSSIYRGIDTQYGLKLADLFNPASIAQRQAAADEQNMGNQLRQMQVMQGVNQLNRAPVMAQREDLKYQQEQGAQARSLQDEQQIRQAIQSSGGDLSKVVQSLIQNGSPAALIMADKVKGMMPKPAEPYTIGMTRFDANNQPVAQGVPAPEKPADWQRPGWQEAERFKAGLKPQAGVDKIPMGYQVQPDGTLKAWQGGPADIKEQAKSSAQELGRENVSQTIAALRDAYGQLKEGGGITDPNASGIGNVTAGIASSGLGQATGRMFGTQNQSKRNEILMTRPALLQHIMKATGMSAKQMDSNAELKLWLSTATDPTLDISANMNALDRIEKTYGIGGAQPAAPTQPKANPHSGKTDAQIRAELGL